MCLEEYGGVILFVTFSDNYSAFKAQCV